MSLWGGRFSEKPEESMVRLSRSVEFDWRLAKYDVLVNLAHTNELATNGIISAGNAQVIKAGLKAMLSDIVNGKFTFNDSDEDVHSAIERGLIEKIGSIGGSIRAGRSRNDLVVTDFKLYLIEHFLEISSLLMSLVETLSKRSEETVDIFAPGFTHLQHAQPISFGHELAKHCHAFMRDFSRIQDWLARNSKSPFGAGALAGSPLQSNPEGISKSLTFDGVMENSIDAVSDRDFVSEALFILATIGVHLSRIGEEFTIWNTSEFSWITLDDKFATGSSIMPQKKNPDIAELARGKSGRLIGNLVSLLTTMKGLPFGYNRDLQEDKEPIFDSVETLLLLLPATIGMIETAKFNKTHIESGVLAGHALATEIADHLTLKGMPFAQAHEISGKCVKYCEAKGKEITDLTLSDLKNIDVNLGEELLKKLSATQAINSRTSSLGTATFSVRNQIEKLNGDIRAAQSWISDARKEFSGMMSL